MTLADSPIQQPSASFSQRIGGALRIAPEVFAEIERDPKALAQAMALVIAAGVARGIGAYTQEGVTGLIGSPILGVATWLFAGALIWLIGAKRYASESTLPEVLRTLGFATAPLLLLALGALPIGPAHPWLWVGAHVWATLALAIATREALDLDTARALSVCVLALVAGFAMLALMGVLVGEWGAFD